MTRRDCDFVDRYVTICPFDLEQEVQKSPKWGSIDYQNISRLEAERLAAENDIISALKCERVQFEEDGRVGEHVALRIAPAPKETEDEGKRNAPIHKDPRFSRGKSPGKRGPAHFTSYVLSSAPKVGVLVASESANAGGVVNIIAGVVKYCDENGLPVVGFRGPSGLLECVGERIYWDDVKSGVNRGGCDILACSTLQEEEMDYDKVMEACTRMNLLSLCVIAGPKDMTWTAHLAEKLTAARHETRLVGIPKSKNGNFYVPRYLPITIGFDSARRCLSELAGNIAKDSRSSKKYWHFIVCGDSALSMEVSLSIRATLCIATEQIVCQKISLQDVISQVADLVIERRKRGRYSGVVVMSDGFVSHHPDIINLRKDIEENDQNISEQSLKVLQLLPESVQRSLLYKRDAKNKTVLPFIKTERFLGDAVASELEKRGISGASNFSPRCHYMGRESGCCIPSPFDCNLGIALGMTAGAMIVNNVHGHFACIQNITQPDVSQWIASALPLRALFGEAYTPQAKIKKVGWKIRPLLMEAYNHFRQQWRDCSLFRSPGPMQFTDKANLPLTLLAEKVSVEELIHIIQPVKESDGEYEEGSYYAIKNVDGTEVRIDLARVENMSELEQERLQYEPVLPSFLTSPFYIVESEITGKRSNEGYIVEKMFPRTHHLDSLLIVPKPKTHHYGGISDSGHSSTGIYNFVKPKKEPRRSSNLVHGPDRRLKKAKNEKSDKSNASSRSRLEAETISAPDQSKLDGKNAKQLRIGVLFGGNQVPGNHNVVAGLFDYLEAMTPKGELIGILGGWYGLMHNVTRILSKNDIARHRNQGGQEMLCQFNSTLSDSVDLKLCLKTLQELNLDGLVVTGHLSTHLETAFLAEACEAHQVMTRVVACPVSAESDFAFVQQTVGKDTVTKVFSSIIGALATEVKSGGDKWYFAVMKCRGGVGGLLECALQTQATKVLLPEQVMTQSVGDLICSLCDLILLRANHNKNYGVILLPESLLARIPETNKLLKEIADILRVLDDLRISSSSPGGERSSGAVDPSSLSRVSSGHQLNAKERGEKSPHVQGSLGIGGGGGGGGTPNSPNLHPPGASSTQQSLSGSRLVEEVQSRLKSSTQAVFNAFPKIVQTELCVCSLEGGIDLANVSTDRLILSMVEVEMDRRKRLGNNVTFRGFCHELSYQSRSAMPTNFDCNLAFSLGYACGILVDGGRNGYLVHASDLRKDPRNWQLGAIPLISLVSTRHSDEGPVITIDGVVNAKWNKQVLGRLPPPLYRNSINPGPIQFDNGDAEALTLSDVNPTAQLLEVAKLMADLQSIAASAEDGRTVEMVAQILENGVRVLRTFKDDSTNMPNMGKSSFDSCVGASLTRKQKDKEGWNEGAGVEDEVERLPEEWQQDRDASVCLTTSPSKGGWIE